MTAEPRSLHERIIAEIGARIVSGEWAPGHRIPFEHELTEQYACSRMTVNKALSQLAQSGLIERRRRLGSFVRRPRSEAAVLDIHDIKAEIAALGLPYRYELISRQVRKAAKTDDFASVAGLVELTCRHFAGNAPFCFEERLISLETVPQAADEPFLEGTPGGWLLDHVPWSAAEHAIRARNADRKMAEALAIAPGTACLVVERRTWSADQLPITRVRLTYVGDGHAVVAHFSPNGA
ncbi:histidine utilization repressor [Aquamicrobium sp. LC103]|uniref:histidine utilization repressor n=1 Tax=Aquamicrobium sp. LC103 TaxID=1120658 RepID=UPI00063ECFA2|nr:histidine utilization repressor [Aquamicrobium sp. LC103]TKT80250.1 histidine utilization repressor [Aquamicrobium sp. LC103]